MKKKISLILLLVILVSALLVGCSGLNFSNSVGEVKYRVIDDHAEVVALPNGSDDADIVIADEYEGVPVTAIGDYVGCNLEAASVIHIGKNLETIGEWTFSNNQKLSAFDVAEDNQHFCAIDGALYSKDLKTLYLYPCMASESVVLPDSVETIKARAFYKKENLKNVALPSGLKSIEEMSFFQCSNLAEINFNEGLESIGKDAFTKCTSLTEITIPKSVKTIDDYAFYNCTSVTSVIVQNKEADMTLGEKWYPTNNGITIDSLNIQWS